MHEVRVTVPEGRSEKVAQAALSVGIDQVCVYTVFALGPNETKEVISAETSTPLAKAFIDALIASDWFDSRNCTLSARELRAIVSAQSMKSLTQPMIEPGIDVLADLWQLSQVTPSYVGRASSAAILLAYGMLENSPISIVAAALFVPFLSQVLALSLGVWSGDRGLVKQGGLALATSTVICIAAGALVAEVHGSKLLFTDFKTPLVSFLLSAVIGLAAGLAIADDAGRRYLIGVAAAVQYAVWPVWLGISLVLGIPDSSIVWERLGTFCINIATIAVTAVVVYRWTGMDRETVRRLHAKLST